MLVHLTLNLKTNPQRIQRAATSRVRLRRDFSLGHTTRRKALTKRKS